MAIQNIVPTLKILDISTCQKIFCLYVSLFVIIKDAENLVAIHIEIGSFLGLGKVIKGSKKFQGIKIT